MVARIAVVGMACRYADATGVDELWQTVLGRRKGFRSLPERRLGAAYRGEQADHLPAISGQGGAGDGCARVIPGQG